MSEAESEEEVDGIVWERELEDDSLAEAQERLEQQFGVDFEASDHGEKGFSRESSLPFYTDVEDTIEFFGKEVEISIERSGGLNTVEFWADDLDIMEAVDMYFEKYTASNGGEPMLEPYKYKEVRDTEVLSLLSDFSDNFTLYGPQERPGNGQPRIYPVRRAHMDDEILTEDDTVVLGQVQEEEDVERGEVTEASYDGSEGYVPGDAQFEVTDPEELDEDIEGKISVSPVKRETGLYKVKLLSEEEKSLTYLINQAAKTLE